jgi:hypothetical protein
MGGAISKAKVQHALEKDSTLLEQFGNLLEQSGVSLSGLHTDPEDSGASDGAVGIDYGWKKALEKAMKDTPLAPSLMEAIQGMRDLDGKVDVDLLEEIIKGKREEWEDLLYSAAGPFKLPTSYKIDFAIAIYVYTLNDPAVYAVVNREMFNKTRRNPGAFSGTSASLRACLPYIKFLDEALEALPDCYVFQGEVRRGAKWVYSSPDEHDPASHFPEGLKIMWYEFKSTSTRQEVMTRKHFCGVKAGPRTIFTVKATRAYAIYKFSYFQGTASEHEVLFRPFSKFKVLHAQKNIINAKEMVSLEKSGFPDAVLLQQVCDAEEEMLRARALQEAEDARVARALQAEEERLERDKLARENTHLQIQLAREKLEKRQEQALRMLAEGKAPAEAAAGAKVKVKVAAVGSAGTFECQSTLSGHSRHVTFVSYSCFFSNVWCVLTIEDFKVLSRVFVSVQMVSKLQLEAGTKASKFGTRRLANASRR